MGRQGKQLTDDVREGTRGGRAHFNWHQVRMDKQKDHYLGSSVKAVSTKFSGNKDLFWYQKEKEEIGDKEKELNEIKLREQEYFNLVLYFKSFYFRNGGFREPNAMAEEVEVKISQRLNQQNQPEELKKEKEKKNEKKKHKKDREKRKRSRERDNDSDDRNVKSRDGYDEYKKPREIEEERKDNSRSYDKRRTRSRSPYYGKREYDTYHEKSQYSNDYKESSRSRYRE